MPNSVLCLCCGRNLAFTLEDGFYWQPDDTKLARDGTRYTMTPLTWMRSLAVGAKLPIPFGGYTQLPKDFAFTQVGAP